MKLEFEYGEGTMSANLPDATDVFIPGVTVKDPPAIAQDWDSLYGRTVASIRNPIGMPPLAELAKKGSKVVFVIPDIVKGDKRILIIDGKPVPYALARIPLAGETRGNLAAGGRGVAQPLSERDRAIAETIGPVLRARGLLLVGLDVIGDYLTEVNVTSPTCFVEITEQTGFDVADCFAQALEKAVGA